MYHPYTVYLITNTINDKKYVGYTNKNPDKRFQQHLGHARRGDKRTLYMAIRKYGEDVFELRPLSSAKDHETAKWMEQRLIFTLDSFSRKGYNMTPGGDGNNFGIESREKQANSLAQDWKLTYLQTGETIILHNLRKFARENNLQATNLIQVAKGKRKQHKGWKCEYAKVPQEAGNS